MVITELNWYHFNGPPGLTVVLSVSYPIVTARHGPVTRPEQSLTLRKH
jgi:hypothetical protein